MASSKIDPWDLVLEHRYEEGLKTYEQRLRQNPDDPAALGSHAMVLLCVGKSLERALEEFRRSSEMERRDLLKLGGKSRPYLAHIGAVLWLLGKQQEAIRTFRSGAEGILSGEIEFGDSAGGASHGLLLWYAGLTAGDKEAIAFARSYLRKLAKNKSTIAHWPGPVVLQVLEGPPKDLMEDVYKTFLPEEAARVASDDLLNRRRLVPVIFYSAVQERADGNEEKCLAKMRECFEIPNSVLEVEWYLARNEVKHFSQGKKSKTKKSK
jgi:hypothetical protein